MKAETPFIEVVVRKIRGAAFKDPRQKAYLIAYADQQTVLDTVAAVNRQGEFTLNKDIVHSWKQGRSNADFQNWFSQLSHAIDQHRVELYDIRVAAGLSEENAARTLGTRPEKLEDMRDRIARKTGREAASSFTAYASRGSGTPNRQ